MILKTAFATLTLLVVWASAPQGVTAEKLSVILPGQNTEFNIDDNDHVGFDIRSSGGVGLSLPAPPGGSLATPRSPQTVLGAPPATVPTSPPGIKGSNFFGNGIGVPIQSSKPTINALYDVPDIGGGPLQEGACLAETVIVTSTSTVFTSVITTVSPFPSTVYLDKVVTSTAIRYQTNFRTSYVTVQGAPQTTTRIETVTSQIIQSQTVYTTTTDFQLQYFTTTEIDYRTQVVTRPVTQEVTVTSLNTQYVSIPVTSTIVRTQVVTSRIPDPTYITVTATQTQYQSAICSTTGYSYNPPAGGSINYGTSIGSSTESSYDSGYYGTNDGSGSYYGNGYYGGGYYGSGYYRPYRRPGRYQRNKGLFGKWF